MSALTDGLGSLHPGAQLFAMLDGEVVVDLAIGDSRLDLHTPMSGETLTLFLSAGKPLTAAAIALLHDQGLLSFEDAVAKHIPEFGVNGKEQITIRHLLTHTAGIRALDTQYPFLTWQETLGRIYNMKPERDWVAGEKAGYHQHTSWYVLGEIINRVAGVSFDRWIYARILLPLGMSDVHFSLTAEEYDSYEKARRLGYLYDTAPKPNAQEFSAPRPIPNYDTVLGASRPRPSASARGPIKQLALFYEMLRNGGRTKAGEQLLWPETVTLMTTRQRVGMFDQTFRQTIDWSLGLILNSSQYGPAIPYQFGPHASASTYGHGGSQSSTGFCDPERKLVVGLLFNGTPGEPAHDKRLRATLKALYEDLHFA